MASAIDKLKSLVVGRTTIGLTGYYKKEKYTLDLDVVDSFTSTHNITISEHPIEKDISQDSYSNIVDHVNAKEPVAGLDCILSTNTNFLNIGKKSITEKEKFQILLFWHTTGSIVQLEGYGTGKTGLIKRIVGQLSSGASGFYNSKLDEPSYFGTDTDIIQNLVLGNLSLTRTTDSGTDLKVKIELKRIKFAIPKTTQKNSSANVNRGSQKNNTQAKKVEGKPVKVSSSANNAFGRGQAK